jgi:hypothetical protein
MKVPQEYQGKYDNVLHSQGKAAADAWLKRKIGTANRKATRDQGRGAVPAVSRSVAKPRAQLSDCAAKLIAVRATPFEHCARGACSGLPPALPTERYFTTCRNTITCTAGQYVGIFLNPAKGVTNDVPFMWTNIGDITTEFSFSTGAGWTTTSSIALGPYADSEFADAALEFRVVGAGLRIRYSGTQLNMGGTACAIMSPDASELWGETVDGVMRWPNVEPIDMGRGWHQASWYPTTPADFEYDSSPSSGGGSGSRSSLGMAFVAAADSVISVETIVHVEAVGSRARPSKQGAADYIGVPAVNQVASQKALHAPEKSTFRTLLDYANSTTDAIGEALTGSFATAVWENGPRVASVIGGLIA